MALGTFLSGVAPSDAVSASAVAPSVGVEGFAKAELVEVLAGAGAPDLPSEMARVESTARERGISIETAMRDYLDLVAASPDGETRYDPDAGVHGYSASVWEDAAALADAERTNFAEALTDVVGGGSGATMQDILDAHADGLVIWGLHAGTGIAWVLWSGSVPGDAARELARLSLDEIEVYTVPYSLDDALEASAHAQSAAQQAFPDTVIGTEIDFFNAQLRVTVGAQPSASANIPRQVDGFPLVTGFDPSMRMNLATGARGGAQLSGCTTSFTLRSSSGAYAVGTAGHCADMTSTVYRNLPPDGTEGVTLYVPTSYYRNGHDLGRWSIGNLGALQTFYYDWNKKRYVDDVSYVGVGVPVWFFDRTSRKRHSERTESVWQTCGGLVGLIYNNKHLGSGGDSGGPLYSGDFAMGVYHGSSCHGKDVFTHATLYGSISQYAVWER